jgi:hypothetical protein
MTKEFEIRRGIILSYVDYYLIKLNEIWNEDIFKLGQAESKKEIIENIYHMQTQIDHVKNEMNSLKVVVEKIDD